MKKLPITCLAAAGLMGLAPAVMASQDNTQETRFYIAPMMSYSMPDNSALDPDDELGGQISVGKNFGDFFALELYGFFYDGMGLNPSGATTGANADVSGFGASALFFPARDILPVYALVGGGDGQYDFSNTGNASLDNQDSEYYEVGAGYMFPLNDYGIKLRAEYRYRSTNVAKDSGGHLDFYDNIVSVGIQVPIGQPATAPAPEPAPVPVGPKDSDGDGVIDSKDECPATPSGVEVDATGCPIEKAAPIVLRGVHFKFDSDDLTTSAQSRLNNVTAALQASPDVEFSIAGHTDSIGSESYNQKLSERRAHSVKSYLVDHGVTTGRITSVTGYGEARPVATNDTAAGRALNRRVELNVTDQ